MSEQETRTIEDRHDTPTYRELFSAYEEILRYASARVPLRDTGDIFGVSRETIRKDMDKIETTGEISETILKRRLLLFGQKVFVKYYREFIESRWPDFSDFMFSELYEEFSKSCENSGKVKTEFIESRQKEFEDFVSSRIPSSLKVLKSYREEFIRDHRKEFEDFVLLLFRRMFEKYTLEDFLKTRFFRFRQKFVTIHRKDFEDFAFSRIREKFLKSYQKDFLDFIRQRIDVCRQKLKKISVELN
ncbi:hypothetical protein [Leptospirillum ferriphilum]|uniref:hypothetical protein n=1 Tax=Leptospirillum ferriphilum TaxID=178606 RepID=UPI0006B1F08B|nr:hypothetical protein [Leptospirillum ferriphilum]